MTFDDQDTPMQRKQDKIESSPPQDEIKLFSHKKKTAKANTQTQNNKTS